MRIALGLLVLVLASRSVQAGLHYSGELLRPFPARWSGYLPDHRLLRTVGNPRLNPTQPVPLLRGLYTEALLKLQATRKQRALTPDELADLGALQLRLGDASAGLDVLRTAARQHPDHFALQANLGTAWQLNGDLGQASAALEEAVRLAKPQQKEAEEFHLKLVRLRLKEGKLRELPGPDELVNWKEAPTAKMLGLVQQLAVWLPSDGRLLWLLGELANSSGDVRTAANCLDGCVTEFAIGSQLLRENRQKYRLKADELDKAEQPTTSGKITFASTRALLRSVDPRQLPAIRKGAENPLPWPVVNETEIGPKGKPNLLKYLEELDGETVTFAGFMTNLNAGGEELSEFLITENPVGCWFCETPGPNQLIRVQLAPGKMVEQSRSLFKITGVLKLNRTDPERLPLQVEQAKISQPD